MYFKDFEAWNTLKKRVETDGLPRNIRTGEVRWTTFGVNIGSEIDGKGFSFARPAVILHPIGHTLALVVPLSTKIKDADGYFPVDFQGTKISVCIHQMKVISMKRILDRKGKMPDSTISCIKDQIKKFFGF